jgi:hypothetical protein
MNKSPVRLFLVLSGILLAVTTFISPSAAATVLPPATYYESAARQGVGPYNDAGTESHTVGTVTVLNPASGPPFVYSAIGTTAVRSSGTDTLNPFVSATSSYRSTFRGFATAEITYSFQILGPTGAQVPVDITLNGSHTFSPEDSGATDGYIDGRFSILDPLTNATIFNTSCDADTCNFSVNPTYVLSTNQILNVDLYLQSCCSGPGTAQTSLDETIAIDSANTVPGASLVFSPGLVVSTPEPDTVWLLLAGFVCTAFAWRWPLVKNFE